jgi:hypothetical protein
MAYLRISTMLQRIVFVVIVVSLSGFGAFAESRNPGGNPGMDPVDPFTADRSPRAMAFKKAWRNAIREKGLLEPLPEGVTGEEQRKRVVDAYEAAIVLMPEAPPCPGFLSLIGNIWKGTFGEATEKPDKAIATYQRLINEYPNAHMFVIQAWAGIARAEYLKGNPIQAAQMTKKVVDYVLPQDASPALVSFVKSYKAGAKKTMDKYSLAVAGGDFGVTEGIATYQIEEMEKTNPIAINGRQGEPNFASISDEDEKPSEVTPIQTEESSRWPGWSYFLVAIILIILISGIWTISRYFRNGST